MILSCRYLPVHKLSPLIIMALGTFVDRNFSSLVSVDKTNVFMVTSSTSFKPSAFLFRISIICTIRPVEPMYSDLTGTHRAWCFVGETVGWTTSYVTLSRKDGCTHSTQGIRAVHPLLLQALLSASSTYICWGGETYSAAWKAAWLSDKKSNQKAVPDDKRIPFPPPPFKKNMWD